MSTTIKLVRDYYLGDDTSGAVTLDNGKQAVHIGKFSSLQETLCELDGSRYVETVLRKLFSEHFVDGKCIKRVEWHDVEDIKREVGRNMDAWIELKQFSSELMEELAEFIIALHKVAFGTHLLVRGTMTSAYISIEGA